VIGRTDQELRRVNNAGPGPLVADAMLWKTRNAGAVIALQNPGGVRKDIPAGEVTIGSVYELLPFGNTLVLLDLSGLELKAALEDAVEHQLANGSKEPYLYVSGVSFQIDVPAAKGQRIQDLKVVDLSGAAVPVRPEQKYRIVTNNYLADGGDGMKVLKNASGFRSDTGFSDAEMFMEFIRNKGVIRNPEDTRILIRPVTFWLSGMKKAA